MNHTGSTAEFSIHNAVNLSFMSRKRCEYDKEGHLGAFQTFILRLSEFGVVCKEKDKDRQTSS